MPNMFDQENPSANPEGDAKTKNAYTSELVGDGKKFDSVEALEKGKIESDTFIEQLKEEQKQLRDDLSKRMSTEELLAEIRKEREDLLKATESAPGNTTPEFDRDGLKSLVSQTIKEEEIARTAEQNEIIVDKRMNELFGDKTLEVFATKATGLGLSKEHLQGVAQKSPSAFFKLMGLDNIKTPTTPASSKGSIDPDGLKEQSAPVVDGSWKYYQKMRKENPDEYWKPETQQRIMKARAEQGSDYLS